MQPGVQEASSDVAAAPDIPNAHAEVEQGATSSGEVGDSVGGSATETTRVTEEKLIEASLEEIADQTPLSCKDQAHKKRLPKKYIFTALSVLILAAVLFVFMIPGTHKSRPSVGLPFSAGIGNIETHVSLIDDVSEISEVVTPTMMKNLSFAAVSFRSLDGCLPDAFASAPSDMISLLDQRNNATGIRPVEGLQKLVKIFYKADVCGKENGIVFVRMVVPLHNDTSYSGLAVRIHEKKEPIVLKWDAQ